MPQREGPKTRPGFALVEYERWMESRDPAILDGPRGLQPRRLRLGLEAARLARRACARRRRRRFGITLGRPEPEDGEPSEELAAHLEETRRRRRGPDAGRPGRPRRAHGRAAGALDPRPAPRLAPARGQARVVAPLLPARGAGRGPRRVARRARATSPSSARWARSSGRLIYRYRYDPEQEHKFHEGDRPLDPATGKRRGHAYTPWTRPPARSTWPRGRENDAPHPTALIPAKPIETNGAARRPRPRGRLGARARHRRRRAATAPRATCSSRRPPRLRGATPATPLAAARRGPRGRRPAASPSPWTDGCLAIQGPPGLGQDLRGRADDRRARQGGEARRHLRHRPQGHHQPRRRGLRRGRGGEGPGRASSRSATTGTAPCGPRSSARRTTRQVESGLAGRARSGSRPAPSGSSPARRWQDASTSSSSTRRARCPSPTSSP